ncbi:MAG: hypothetical protein LBF41_08225 [Deltaproteobacteria bacterium]|jgi:hypothetical protein|nr:hypothetical protein [Deltaproteobacteria bacterium]
MKKYDDGTIKDPKEYLITFSEKIMDNAIDMAIETGNPLEPIKYPYLKNPPDFIIKPQHHNSESISKRKILVFGAQSVKPNVLLAIARVLE